MQPPPSTKVIVPDRQALLEVMQLAGSAGLVLVVPTGSPPGGNDIAVVHHERVPAGWEVVDIERETNATA